MSTISGVVEKTHTHNTKVGKTYTFAIGDDWYSTFKTSLVDEGDYVEFEFTSKGGFNNVVNDTLKKLDPDTAPAEKKEAVADAKKAYSNKDLAIRWQYACKLAGVQTGVLSEQDVLDLGNGKKGEKVEAYLVVFDQLAVRNFQRVNEVFESGDLPEDLQ